MSKVQVVIDCSANAVCISDQGWVAPSSTTDEGRDASGNYKDHRLSELRHVHVGARP